MSNELTPDESAAFKTVIKKLHEKYPSYGRMDQEDADNFEFVFRAGLAHREKHPVWSAFKKRIAELETETARWKSLHENNEACINNQYGELKSAREAAIEQRKRGDRLSAMLDRCEALVSAKRPDGESAEAPRYSFGDTAFMRPLPLSRDGEPLGELSFEALAKPEPDEINWVCASCLTPTKKWNKPCEQCTGRISGPPASPNHPFPDHDFRLWLEAFEANYTRKPSLLDAAWWAWHKKHEVKS